MTKYLTVSVNQGSPKATKSCSSGKLSLMSNHFIVCMGCARHGQQRHFLRLFYLESRDQILEEVRSNELVPPWHLSSS